MARALLGAEAVPSEKMRAGNAGFFDARRRGGYDDGIKMNPYKRPYKQGL